MYMRFLILFFAFIAFKSMAQAPTGPGGVGNSTTNVVFMRADLGPNNTTNGGNVTQWFDQSGNNNTFTNATNPAIFQNVAPVNGLPTVKFNGSNNFLTGPNNFPINSDYTKFVVGRYIANGGNNFFSGNTGHAIYMASTNTPKVYDNGVFLTSSKPLAISTYGIISVTYKNSIPNRLAEIFINSESGGTNTTTVAPTDASMHLGSHNTGNVLNGDLAEVIAYNYQVNIAQRIIIENYLSAKYNIAIAAPAIANDVYTMDDPANGNYDFDVAGIGRVNASNIHSDAQGTGPIRILNATDLGDGEYFMWGNDNGSLTATNSSDIPLTVSARLARVWRVSETGGNGDVGSVDIQIDVTTLPDFASLSTCDGASAIRLLVDTNNNGLFADQSPIAGATNIGGNIYRFANVSALSNGNRFTIAIVRNSNGPGGVGTAATNFLFLRSDVGTSTTTNNTAITTWNDQSGNANNASQSTVASKPIYLTNQLNGFPAVDFNGTTQFMTAPSSFPINSDFTKFVVGKIKATTTNNNYFSGVTGHGLRMNLLSPQLYQGAAFLTSSQPMVIGTYAVIGNTFVNSSKTGEVFVAGASGGSAVATTVNTDAAIQIGSFNSTAAEMLNGTMTEVIGYNFKLNSAQIIIVENYLAAKYGLTLATAADKYTRDDAPFNYDYDVAGIGRVDASNLHRDSRGTGMVRISNPTDLNDGEFFIWGHNNGSLASTNTTDVPTGIQGRMNRVWSVSEPGGDTGSLDVQFDLTGQGSIVASDLRLLIDHNGNGIFNEVGTVVISGATALSCNNYSFTVVTSLNDGVGFTIGSVNVIQTPLPISLTSFTGRMDNGKSLISWTTASEHNNDYFNVERSADGEKFISIKKVTGAGTTANTNNYEVVDEYAPAGKIYYRLRQVDYDGKFTFSKIIALDNNATELKLIVSPNPVNASKEISIQLFQPKGTSIDGVAFELYDAIGRSTPVIVQQKDGNNWILKLAQPEASTQGIYILRIVVPGIGKTLVQRIVIAK